MARPDPRGSGDGRGPGTKPPPALLPVELRNRIPREEFDYQTLLLALQGYASPRDKITDLLRQGVILRLKKGLYVFGDSFRRRPPSLEILANLMYGPSYISLEYALQSHRLIPEAVEAVTSVTCGRPRRFRTPLGEFSYRMIPLRAYSVGVELNRLSEDISYFIATPEKALADKLASERGTGIRTSESLRSYLFDNLRIDPGDLARLDHRRMGAVAEAYHSRRIRLLASFIREIAGNEGGT